MRWYEYKMEVDDLHASEGLKAKLLAMQAKADASGKPCRFLHQHIIFRLFVSLAPVQQTEIQRMHIRIAEKQAEHGVRQPGKVHIQQNIMKIMGTVKAVPVGILRG